MLILFDTADKATRMSKEELLSKVSESVASGDEEYNKVLSRSVYSPY